MRPSRLSGRKVCNALRTKGRVWKGRTMVIAWLPLAPRHPLVDPLQPAVYLGTYASASLSKRAVDRNRMRRRCREAVRIHLRSLPSAGPLQLLLSPRSPSLTCSFGDIAADVRAFFSSLPA